MLTQMDKSWVAGLVAFLGHFLTSKLGWNFITPELVGLIAGVVTYWVPNAAPATPTETKL